MVLGQSYDDSDQVFQGDNNMDPDDFFANFWDSLFNPTEGNTSVNGELDYDDELELFDEQQVVATGDLSNFDGDAFFDSLIEEFEGQVTTDQTTAATTMVTVSELVLTTTTMVPTIVTTTTTTVEESASASNQHQHEELFAFRSLDHADTDNGSGDDNSADDGDDNNDDDDVGEYSRSFTLGNDLNEFGFRVQTDPFNANFDFIKMLASTMTMNSRNAVNTNDSCWRCSSATLGECENDGGYETCPGVDDVCYVELRKRSGIITNIQTGCRSSSSCNNLKHQNFHATSYIWSQCRPEAKFAASRFNMSKCSQCFAKCDRSSDRCFLATSGIPQWTTPQTYWNLETDGLARSFWTSDLVAIQT